MTALGNPKLLERVSAGLLAIKNLFSRFDLDHDDVITREEFSSVSSPCQIARLQNIVLHIHGTLMPGLLCTAGGSREAGSGHPSSMQLVATPHAALFYLHQDC